MRPTVGFPLFLAFWNRAQGMRTPQIHFHMSRWLEQSWRRGDKRLLLQAFRSSGKSTIAGLFAAWLLYCNPDLRILVLSADAPLAQKMVRNVRRIIEKHPLTASLKPERLDQWGADRFTVKRGAEWRDPSMLARGIGANVTGSRADIVICDDVEVPRTCDTAGKRIDLRERLGEIGFVLVPGGTILYIGTPHSWHSIYAEEPCRDSGEGEAFLHGYGRLTIPVENEEGKSAWPERFSPESIERMKRESGPNKFASQMMLDPTNIAEGRLDLGLLRFYGGALCRSAELGGLYLEGKKLLSCSAWWDPAFGRQGHGGDASVLAVAFTDEDGCIRLHCVEYISIDPLSSDDEATQQCRTVALTAKKLFVPCVAVETNGIGKFLPAILRREMARNRAPCRVREIVSTRAKDMRILEAFDAPLAARLLQVHDSVTKTPFITEMREWRPGAKGQRDDGLDAAAGALSLEPIRFNHESFAGRHAWMEGAGMHEAKTDFDP